MAGYESRDSTNESKITNVQTYLLNSRDFLSLLFNQAPVSYVVVNNKGTIIQANTKFSELVKINISHIINTNLSHFISREDRKKFNEKFQTFFHDPVRYGFEIEINSGKTKLFAELKGARVAISSRDANSDNDLLLVLINDVTKLYKWKQSLIQNEKKFRYLFNYMNSAFAYHQIIFDGQGEPVNYRFLEVNQAFEKMTGSKAENIVGELLTEVFPDTSKDSVDWIALYGKVNKTGESRVFESYSAAFKKWFKISAYTPQEGYFATVFEDITHEKELLIKLRESELKYRSLFEFSKDANMILEPPSWKFTAGNQALLEMFKLTNEKDFTQLTPWDISPEKQPDGCSSKDRAVEMIDIALSKGMNYFEWTHRRKNGEEFFTTVLLNRVNLNEKVILFATIRDITEEKQAQIALREKEEKYRSLFEKSTDPSLVIKDCIFVDCNLATLNLLKYKSKSDIIGKSPWEIAPKFQPDGKESEEKIKQFITQATNSGYNRFECVVINSEKAELWMDVSLTLIREKGQNLIYMTARDITEKIKNEMELKKYRENLELIIEERTREIEEKNKTLEQRNAELSEYNRMFVNREFRIKQLNDKIKDLQMRLEIYEK